MSTDEATPEKGTDDSIDAEQPAFPDDKIRQARWLTAGSQLDLARDELMDALEAMRTADPDPEEVLNEARAAQADLKIALEMLGEITDES